MRFEPNTRNINSFMKTPETGNEVQAVARRIEAAAGSNGGFYRTDITLGRRRWRAAVIGNYDFANSGGLEGSRRDLLRGMDGA